MNVIFAVFAFVYVIILLAMLGVSIYGFILFVKVARRGIKALDIYLEEKSREGYRSNNS